VTAVTRCSSGILNEILQRPHAFRIVIRLGRSVNALKACSFPGCEKPGTQPHHVTYNPEVIKTLCAAHHDEITMLNMQQGRKCRHQLSNNHRWYLWNAWIRGRKVRRTAKSVEDLADWKSQAKRYR
jgi:hypothetical protein